MMPRIATLILLTLLGWSLAPERASAVETISIRFDAFSAETGLKLSITTPGDEDGISTFSNTACCGIDNAQKFVRDVIVHADGQPLPATQDASGWTVSHAPRALLTVSYRLPPSGPMMIDTGVPDQLRPIVHDGMFHLIGTFALLLPTGRAGSDRIEVDVDATRVADNGHFVSSFGPGNKVAGVRVNRSRLKAIFVGGAISLTVRDTPAGKVGVVYSAMDPNFRSDAFTEDTLAILGAERAFFNDGQPWYLVSLHGGDRKNPRVNLGGGTGLTNSFAMFARADLDASEPEHREHFRWVLAHEYFHEWNGLTLRVASQPNSRKDDTSIYWFSEGVTEFYTMRILTRAGLQSSARSRSVLNDKLQRYASNSRQGVSAIQAGRLFWTDPDGEQIPYLRGYLAAWLADIATRRSSRGASGLDSAIRSLVTRAKAEPGFRVDNSLLASYLTKGLSTRDAGRLRRFIIDGGVAPFDADSFAPCMVGKRQGASKQATLRFEFANVTDQDCFIH